MRRYRNLPPSLKRLAVWLAVLALLMPIGLGLPLAPLGGLPAQLMADAHILCSGHFAPGLPTSPAGHLGDCPCCLAQGTHSVAAFLSHGPALPLPAGAGTALNLPSFPNTAFQTFLPAHARDSPILV